MKKRQFTHGAIKAVLFLILFLGCSKADSRQAFNFDNALATAQREGKVVMIELGSEGCIPCENMKPVMAKLSSSYGERLSVIFVDVRKDTETARRFGVHMIPVQVFLDKNGREFYRHVGFFSYEEIEPVLRSVGL